jgi:hypothetical protein
MVACIQPQSGRLGSRSGGVTRLGASIAMLYPVYELTGLDAQIDLLRRFKDVAGGV